MGRLLGLGADVICLMRDWVPHSQLLRSRSIEQVKVVRGDVRQQELLQRVLAEHGINTVLHLAAQAIVGTANRNPVATFEANINGTWSVLEACRHNPQVRQIVVASSDHAYGGQAGLPYTEDMSLQGCYPYDASKSCMDLVAQSYAATYDLPVAITRFGNLYGGSDWNWNRVVPGTIRSILRGERPVIRSDGQYVRDYLYVEDGAGCYTFLAEQLGKNPNLGGEAFNFSYETPLTVVEIVERILKLMDSDLTPDVRNEASNEIRCQYLSTAKARQLGWRPMLNLEDGLKKTIDWYKAYFAEKDD